MARAILTSVTTAAAIVIIIDITEICTNNSSLIGVDIVLDIRGFSLTHSFAILSKFYKEAKKSN